MDKNTGTNQIFHSQPVSKTNSQESTTSEVLISGEELSQKLTTLKSVNFLTTATSTTTLSEKEPLKKLRPELSTLLTCSIKQTRSIVKATHHTQILSTAILNRDPPRGLRPKVNPRIPDSKNIDFIIEWEEVTNNAALSYTKLLLKNWENTLKTAKENIQNLELRITSLQATKEEWTYIRETLLKIEEQTREDLERKVQRGPRPWKTQEEDHQQASTSFNQTRLQSQNQFSHEQLPQRRQEDFRGRVTRL